MKLNNLTGRCDTWNFEGGSGFNKSREGKISVSIPRGYFGNPWKIQGAREISNFQDSSSYFEDSTGFDVSTDIDKDSITTLGFGAQLRDIIPVDSRTRRASSVVAFESLTGSSLKTSLKHTLTHNRLDNAIIPTNGQSIILSSVALFVLLLSSLTEHHLGTRSSSWRRDFREDNYRRKSLRSVIE